MHYISDSMHNTEEKNGSPGPQCHIQLSNDVFYLTDKDSMLVDSTTFGAALITFTNSYVYFVGVSLG